MDGMREAVCLAMSIAAPSQALERECACPLSEAAAELGRIEKVLDAGGDLKRGP